MVAKDELLLKAAPNIDPTAARIVLELPIGIPRAQAHGIPVDSAHLVLSDAHPGKGGKVVSRLFADLVTQAKTVAVVVVGAFASKEELTELLGTEHSDSLLGSPTYLVQDADSWKRIAQVRAEWIAFMAADAILIRELSVRLKRHESRWWKLSNKSDLGTLTSEIDLIDPLAIYFPSEETLELFGTYDRILFWFQAITCPTSSIDDNAGGVSGS